MQVKYLYLVKTELSFYQLAELDLSVSTALKLTRLIKAVKEKIVEYKETKNNIIKSFLKEGEERIEEPVALIREYNNKMAGTKDEKEKKILWEWYNENLNKYTNCKKKIDELDNIEVKFDIEKVDLIEELERMQRENIKIKPALLLDLQEFLILEKG